MCDITVWPHSAEEEILRLSVNPDPWNLYDLYPEPWNLYRTLKTQRRMAVDWWHHQWHPQWHHCGPAGLNSDLTEAAELRLDENCTMKKSLKLGWKVYTRLPTGNTLLFIFFFGGRLHSSLTQDQWALWLAEIPREAFWLDDWTPFLKLFSLSGRRKKNKIPLWKHTLSNTHPHTHRHSEECVQVCLNHRSSNDFTDALFQFNSRLTDFSVSNFQCTGSYISHHSSGVVSFSVFPCPTQRADIYYPDMFDWISGVPV